ncbi:methyltransferase domain-containing protein [Silanimonas sp.]|uniref:class I SAM-dependent methyltransferase n=1 Tax=Silanimonas sp. TaxID=1929290 RepID=UPI001BC210E8|nr:methyltransferase domain-containing protein [Silanimonas sp.]MBS3895900.1 methyltransferase domain-containing protein [Silanimonas sp.]
MKFGPLEIHWRRPPPPELEPTAPAPEPTPATRLHFTCNICGTPAQATPAQLGRELPSCPACGSTVRFRSLIALLGRALGRGDLPLAAWPVDTSIAGLGLSDWPGYADRLAKVCDYRNTHYHAEPKLDIAAPPVEWQGRFDFLLSSDVFEHVLPPVETAFTGSFRLLKPGGVLVLTVPCIPAARTREHYPDATGYRVDSEGRVLLRRAAGDEYPASDPVFHGGPGATLEMRLFGALDLQAGLEAAGFEAVRFHPEAIPEAGVLHTELFSLPLTARKPLQA